MLKNAIQRLRPARTESARGRLGGDQRADILPVENFVQDAGLATVGDDHRRADAGDHVRGLELGRHAAGRKFAAFALAWPSSSAVTPFSNRHAAHAAAFARRLEAVHRREQNQQVGLDQQGDERGQAGRCRRT